RGAVVPGAPAPGALVPGYCNRHREESGAARPGALSRRIGGGRGAQKSDVGAPAVTVTILAAAFAGDQVLIADRGEVRFGPRYRLLQRRGFVRRLERTHDTAEQNVHGDD